MQPKSLHPEGAMVDLEALTSGDEADDDGTSDEEAKPESEVN